MIPNSILILISSKHVIGARFNETEVVAAITSLIRHYQIEIQDEPQFKHETFEERKSRILEPQLTITLACVDPVRELAGC